ncbi:MAG: hypothetical protein ACKVU2_14130, partial [Saprospiraceae bacterium]
MAKNTVQYLLRKFNLLKFKTKLWLAGIYFTWFKNNRIVLDGVELIVPDEVTDIPLRGQLQIGFYEREERRHLKKYLKPDSTILELGGCLGVVSCIANKLLQNPEQHVVVEANPNLIRHLERNKAHTGSAFAIEHCVISNRLEQEFFLGDTILGSSIRNKSPKKILVPGKTVA